MKFLINIRKIHAVEHVMKIKCTGKKIKFDLDNRFSSIVKKIKNYYLIESYSISSVYRIVIRIICFIIFHSDVILQATGHTNFGSTLKS